MNSVERPEGHLRKNLQALALTAPRLAERLCEPICGNHVETRPAATGAVTARLKEPAEVWIHSTADPEKDAEQFGSDWKSDGGGSVLCLGLGLGYEVKSLLKRMSPTQTVLAYERDPWLLRNALICHDFSKDLIAKRLVFLLGTELGSVALPDSIQVVLHPVLGAIYREEEYFVSQRLHGRSRTRAMMVAGGLFVRDVMDGLRSLGVEVLVWDPTKVSLRETRYQIKYFQPEFIFSINYSQGLPELCAESGTRYVIWEIDPSIERLPNRPQGRAQTHVYTYRKQHVNRYRQAGFSSVEYLPLAANPERRRPLILTEEERLRYGTDVSFVGNSMSAQSRQLYRVFHEVCEINGIHSPERTWETLMRAQESSPGRPADPNRFLSLAGSEDSPGYVLPDKQGRAVDLNACVGEKAASDRRFRIVRSLLEDGRDVAVWGDDGWREGLSGARYCGWAGHDRELTRIYNASRINLDIGRLYQHDIVTMRVYDVLACRGFALVDDSADLRERFDVGQEVIAYRSIEELKSLTNHFLLHETDRNAVAAAGHQRVLRDHTIAARLQKILNDLR